MRKEFVIVLTAMVVGALLGGGVGGTGALLWDKESTTVGFTADVEAPTTEEPDKQPLLSAAGNQTNEGFASSGAARNASIIPPVGNDENASGGNHSAPVTAPNGTNHSAPVTAPNGTNHSAPVTAPNGTDQNAGNATDVPADNTSAPDPIPDTDPANATEPVTGTTNESSPDAPPSEDGPVPPANETSDESASDPTPDPEPDPPADDADGNGVMRNSTDATPTPEPDSIAPRESWQSMSIG